MASLRNSKTIFGFTSPRTIEKIIPEIKLLHQNFSGKKWNTQTQSEFYTMLQRSEFFEESMSPKKDPAFSARDRITRAPKALGFIALKPEIYLTEVGQLLMSGKRVHDVITRQLMKFQLHSPYHTESSVIKFWVRPYLELLRLIYELKEISKIEIAMFFTQLTSFEKYEKIKNKIITFRNESSQNRTNRKSFIIKCFEKEVHEIYYEEINNQEYTTRESDDISHKKFINTKMSNMKDYADAFIRYLRATQLITFDKKTFRVIVAPSKLNEVEYILETISREPIEFVNLMDFENYLFNGTNIKLLYDNKEFIEQRLNSLDIKYDSTLPNSLLVDILDRESIKILESKIEETKLLLKEYKEYDDVIDVFRLIKSRDVPDPPLYLEWNIWRAFVMINYTTSIVGNFKIDYDGVPLSTAAGNKPDIEIEYETFKMIVEVTMSSGNTQYNMEGEPVPRHYGKIKSTTHKDVFCIFIAPNISNGTLAHFFNLNRMNTKLYGGKTKIIPLDIDNFLTFISIAKDRMFNDPKKLHLFLNTIWEHNQSSDDEDVWFSLIKDLIPQWLNKSYYTSIA